MRPRTVAHRPVRSSAPQTLLSHLLDPIDLLSQTIFSVLIMLNFTVAYRIFLFEQASDPVRSVEQMQDLLFAALGATIAWGLIDGVMYALVEILQRGERQNLLYHLQAATSHEEAIELIADEFDYVLEPIAGEEQRHVLYQDIFFHLRDSQPQLVGLQAEDLTGGLASVVVAVGAVLPSLLPLWLFQEQARLALGFSNAISFGMLFVAGLLWGRYTGANPWKIGFLLLALGVVMVGIAVFLGG
ncbi:MAG: hypothetical protein HC837_17060 [Chloroflexaceae bacterium]|nr:hypothetical protein [Chloroflexaceae bacterium]